MQSKGKSCSSLHLRDKPPHFCHPGKPPAELHGPLPIESASVDYSHSKLPLRHLDSRWQHWRGTVLQRGCRKWILPSTTQMLAGDIGNGWSTLLESNQIILMADFSELASTPFASAWNRCLQDLSDRLETLGRSMSDHGLPEPVRELTEVDRKHLRWSRESCQQFVDAPPTLSRWTGHFWRSDGRRPQWQISGWPIWTRQDSIDEGHHCCCPCSGQNHPVHRHHQPCCSELQWRHDGTLRCTRSQSPMKMKLHIAM